MALSRRDFLERCAALGVTAVVLPQLGCGEPDDGLPDDGFPRYTWDGEPGPEDTFAHGVASGDPLSDAVLLWTKVSPGEGATGPVDVFVEVALTPTFTERVAVNTVQAVTDRGFCVTVDQTELLPGTTYYYRFSALGRTSPVGRTRTFADGPTERLRLAFCSCSNYGYGYFHAYRHLARRADLDAFVHLGDYIYEHASDGYGNSFGIFRALEPLNEIVTLDDYRARYGCYRGDPDLQEAHRQHPIVHVWDDHEFADNPKIGGSNNHDPETEGSWDDRVVAALQAHAEWIPSRVQGNRIYREFLLGDLAHLMLVDRQRRFLFPADDDGELYLGKAQTDWVLERLPEVTAPWLIFCTGTSFTSRKADGGLGSTFDGSPWDAVSRRQILDAVADAGIENLVVVMGDIHRAEALDVAHDPSLYDPETGDGSEGVEFACGSIGSPGLPTATEGVPQFLWSDPYDRTYLLLDVTRTRLQAEWWGFTDALKMEIELPEERLVKAFACEAGSHHLVETTTPTEPRTDAPALAPTARAVAYGVTLPARGRTVPVAG